jgi:hypothetical protein
VFCATALAGSFLPLYDSSQSYGDLNAGAFEVVTAVWEPMVESFVRLGAFLASWEDFSMILPSSFSWPDLPGGFGLAFEMSVILAVVAAALPQMLFLYKHFGLETWGKEFFEFEEVILKFDEKNPDQEGDNLAETIDKKATFEVEDEHGKKTTQKGVKTGRQRLKKGQGAYWVVLVLTRGAMAGAVLLSIVQQFLVLLRNRKPLNNGFSTRNTWWSMEQKYWSLRNFAHVNDATVQQFVVDNPQAAQLFLATCTNITVVPNIGELRALTTLNLTSTSITGIVDFNHHPMMIADFWCAFQA